MLFLIYAMLRCLNPKKTHENRGSFARSVPAGKTIALSATTSPAVGDAEEVAVTCQYCKYLLEGAVLGDCRVIRWLGSGTFGDVYEAEQLPPLSRRVAIKVMAIERVIDGESAEMFAHEVNTVAALDHPNILPVLRVGLIDDGRPYLVMKYAARGSLQQFCQPIIPISNLPKPVATVIPADKVETPVDAAVIVSTAILSTLETRESETVAGGETPGDEQTQHGEAQEQTSQGIRYGELPVMAIPDEPAAETGIDKVISPQNSAQRESARTTEANTDPEAEQTAEPRAAIPATPSEVEADEQTPELTLDTAIETPQNTQSPQDNATPGALADTHEIAEIDPATAQTPPSDSEQLMHEQSEETMPIPGSAPEEESRAENAGEPASELTSTLMLAHSARPGATVPSLSASNHALPLPLQQVLSYAEEAASALAYAHQRGLIHLDVKPANLLLDAQGRLMLADFGVAVLLEGYTHASLHYYVGTPLYTAPEQWLEQPRPASDQYALAITCYQLLAGQPPFTGNLYAVMHGHLQAPPPPISEFNPLLPTQVEGVLQRALAKDPTERYPDILAFARALREATESAASATTDPRMQQQTTLLLEQDPLSLAGKVELPVASVNDEEFTEDVSSGTQARPEPGTFRFQRTEWELPAVRLRAGRGSWLRNLLLCALALLLIVSGSLGFVRSQRPCWLGICPQIQLSASTLTLTNDATQPIEITNRGTDTLNWQAFLPANVPWLSFSPGTGTLAPGKSGRLIVKADVDGLDLDPSRVYTYTSMIDVAGGPGVETRTIQVTENVAKGLSAVSVTTSGQMFVYEQNKLKPGKQTITITNQSGRALNWFTQYTDNNWLSVTPGLGSLQNQKTLELTATVENPQKLANDIYQVRFSLVGQLDNQSDLTLLQTINFTLQVNQSQAAQLAPTVPALSPTKPPDALSFSAQPIEANGAPDTRRFNHSMVWDTQNNQLLIFGGSDGQGNLLNDLWSFSPTNDTWTNLVPANVNASASDCSGSSPSPRTNAALVWDNNEQEALLYGGISSNNSYLGDLWAYSPEKGSWKLLACSGNGPGGRGAAGAIWNGSQMLLLGGRGDNGFLSDFWAYAPDSGGWSELAPTTPLGARAYSALAWDSHDKQLYAFGGLGANGQQFGDFYSYQSVSGWSTSESGASARPMPRQQALCTWDSKDKVFLLMGGWQSGNSTPFSALWAYSPGENTWWQITSLYNNNISVIPSRMASGMVWDSADNRAYIYAGSSGVNKSALNDLWMIEPGQ
ncbi:MAG TPA: kelch repeat-containing protein [Ktedonobacteraceae bacterium]